MSGFASFLQITAILLWWWTQIWIFLPVSHTSKAKVLTKACRESHFKQGNLRPEDTTGFIPNTKHQFMLHETDHHEEIRNLKTSWTCPSMTVRSNYMKLLPTTDLHYWQVLRHFLQVGTWKDYCLMQLNHFKSAAGHKTAAVFGAQRDLSTRITITRI